MALYQDSGGEKRKYKLENFDKCSFKVPLERSETVDPLDPLHSGREVTGKGSSDTPTRKS